jgi:hypothetical protein
MTAAQLLALAQDYIPESDPLHDKIGAFLGEPVHVGDTITVEMQPAWNHQWRGDANEPPEGLQVTEHRSSYEFEGETRDITYRTYVFPEAGEARYLTSKDYNGSFVTEINGRRYQVTIYIEDGEMGCEGGAVTFTRTEDPVTEFSTWSHADAVAEYRASKVRCIENNQKELEKDPESEWAEYNREDIKDAQRDIDRIDAGDVSMRHPYYVQVFGQPRFVQGEVVPAHEGRCGMALASIETGWGDCGNVVILFACDENGVPCRAWFEASCC